MEADKNAYSVDFYCWGQHCRTEFPDLEIALRWCVICIEKGFHIPVEITNARGVVIYDKNRILDYMKDMTE